MRFVDNIVPKLAQALRDGHHIVIATLIQVDGSSPRPVGSQIGIVDDGRAFGMITGGCAEKAIIAEGLACLSRKANQCVRYGDGSPFLDVVLPCGSGIDIYFDVQNAAHIIDTVGQAHAARQPIWYSVDRMQLQSALSREACSAPHPDQFEFRMDPAYQLLAFGEGANLVTLATLAVHSGFIVQAFTPDQDSFDFLDQHAIQAHRIHRTFDFTKIAIDPYTALITLFHEHEWESAILHAALNSDADYIGALGSRRTHQLRLEQLARMPTPRQSTAVIHGPVGLDIGAQSPSEIAISILAQIISQRRGRQL